MEKLKGQTILIGKEPGQGRLLVAMPSTGKSAAIGAPGSVPDCVSRCRPAEGVAHVRIAVDKDGRMVLTNLKPQNVTFVNGAEIASKHVSATNTLELGKDHYKVSIPLVLDTARKIMLTVPQPPQPPKRFSIAHLAGVWDTFERTNAAIAHRQQDMGRKRMLPIMLGSFSTLASAIIPALGVSSNTLFVTLPVAAVSFGLYFSTYRKKDTSFEDRKVALDRFTDDYVCPNPECGRFLGNQSYKLLKKQTGMHCPYCKCEFTE